MSKYTERLHAMQSGVAMEMNYDSSPTSPKHLRVGINSAMVNDAAIARLLIAKGVITMEEYEEAITAEMDAEASRYEERLTRRVGSKVTLG